MPDQIVIPLDMFLDLDIVQDDWEEKNFFEKIDVFPQAQKRTIVNLSIFNRLYNNTNQVAYTNKNINDHNNLPMTCLVDPYQLI